MPRPMSSSSAPRLSKLELGGIRTLRQAAKLKLADVASSIGMPPESLKLIERGLVALDAPTASKLAAVLGEPVAVVLAVHDAFRQTATPGEGYTTSKSAPYKVLKPRRPLPASDNRRRVVDLFCGAGGLSYGFERAGGYVTVAGIDLLQDRVDTFTANHEHAYGLAGDIRRVEPADVLELVGRVDVVVGGPPCQGFSSIRPFRTLTERDPRNNLVENYVLMLVALQPDWFVFENVVGLVTHEGGSKLDAIIVAFSEAGYRVSWRVVNAAMYGVPQSRERVVIVGNRLGVEFVWPRPTHFIEYKSMAGRRPEVIRPEPIFDGPLPPAITLIDAIGDLPPVDSGQEATTYLSAAQPPYAREIRNGATSLTWHRSTQHSAKMLEIIRHAGSSIADLPPGLVTSGFSSCYSRLDADRPSNTITVNFVHPSSNRCIHPYQDRALTPREGARIQSFPDTFQFCGTSAQVVKQIGNAVPPRLGEVIAQRITECSREPSYQRATVAV
jgi:DNA (cytosine-5)-methyltransferase 1